MRKVNLYFIPKGLLQTPNHSEYEGVERFNNIRLIRNAFLRGNFIIVRDEKKPVYIVADSSISGYFIYKIDNHCQSEELTQQTVSINFLRSSEIQAQIQNSWISKGQFSGHLEFSLRRDNEIYYASNSNRGTISFTDVIDFVVGDIKWEDLAKRSEKFIESNSISYKLKKFLQRWRFGKRANA